MTMRHDQGRFVAIVRSWRGHAPAKTHRTLSGFVASPAFKSLPACSGPIFTQLQAPTSTVKSCIVKAKPSACVAQACNAHVEAWFECRAGKHAGAYRVRPS